MRVKSCAVLVFFGVVCVLSGYAQETTGTISGTVKDSTGAVLPGVSLVLLNQETGSSRTVQTNSAGRP